MKKHWHVLLLFFSFIVLPVQAQEDGVESLRQTGKAFASVARKVSPSVVFIQVESKAPESSMRQFSSPFGDDLFKHFFGDQLPGTPRAPRSDKPQGEPRAIAQGSGFVFAAEDGPMPDKTYILTNNHVVKNADKIRVRLQDGHEYDARITGRDPQSDVAVIEIDVGGLPALQLADSARLEFGEWVVAIGNPFGLSHTLTVGVVSAKGRTGLGINDYENRVALTRPGSQEQLTIQRDGKRKDLPVIIGKLTKENLTAQGSAQSTEELGLTVQTLTPQLAEQFGAEPGEGVVVTEVRPGSSAAMAGIEPGILILQANHKVVKSAAEFKLAVKESSDKKRVLLLIRKGDIQRYVALSW